MSTLLKLTCAAALLFLSACGGTLVGDCASCSGSARYIHGYPKSRDLGPEESFAHRNEVVHVTGPTEVDGYNNSTIYCSSGATADGMDNATVYAGDRCHATADGHATIYYRDGADVHVQDQARLFKCPGSGDEPWDTSKCVQQR